MTLCDVYKRSIQKSEIKPEKEQFSVLNVCVCFPLVPFFMTFDKSLQIKCWNMSQSHFSLDIEETNLVES